MSDMAAANGLLTDTHALLMPCSQFLRVDWLGPRPSYDTTVAVPSCGDGAKGEQAAGPGRLLLQCMHVLHSDGDTGVAACQPRKVFSCRVEQCKQHAISGTHGRSQSRCHSPRFSGSKAAQECDHPACPLHIMPRHGLHAVAASRAELPETCLQTE